jgi:hypothetical protein
MQRGVKIYIQKEEEEEDEEEECISQTNNPNTISKNLSVAPKAQHRGHQSINQSIISQSSLISNARRI